MWIRSQDKRILGKVNRLVVSSKNEVLNYFGYTDTGEDYDILGKYETEERAIEVLNYVQRELKNYQPSHEKQFMLVCEMPKE